MKYLKNIKNWEEMMNTVICGDCFGGMKLIPDKSIDLVLTDPPYGIDYNNKNLNNRRSSREYGNIQNDKGEIDYTNLIVELQRIAKIVIIFGAINFFKDLPYKGVWICWDKRTKVEVDNMLGSPFELAWCDKKSGYDKIYRIMHGGAVNADGAHMPRFCPTQKPVELMRQILLDFSNKDTLICDPFMGSWTTARACKDLGRNFIGFEISEKYCKIGEERLRQEVLF